jgi:hypothetical protein
LARFDRSRQRKKRPESEHKPILRRLGSIHAHEPKVILTIAHMPPRRSEHCDRRLSEFSGFDVAAEVDAIIDVKRIRHCNQAARSRVPSETADRQSPSRSNT